jgi:hypothetical protein
VLEAQRTGAFRRPAGRLQAPPREVNGIEVFPIEMPDDLSRAVSVYRDFSAHLGRNSDIDEARLRTLQVIVASPAWIANGVNDFSATLVRELSAAGLHAHILLTEENTALIARPDHLQAYPPDVRFERLPVEPDAGWSEHWAAMIRYLEERTPCVYIPNHDWRHSCVCPVLSDQVLVVGVMHGDDPLHDDHARRLGRYWNAAVLFNENVARRVAKDPALGPRAYRMTYAEQGMASDFLFVFDRAMKEVDTGVYRRPAGTLQPPPREVAGCSLFDVELSDAEYAELAHLTRSK